MTTHQLPGSSELRHLPGLPEGMPTIRTHSFRRAQVVAKEAIRVGEIAAFIGNAGLGKTFAVDYAVRASGMPWLWVQIGPHPTPNEVTKRLLKQLTGVKPNDYGYHLTDELVAELREEPHIVVIDDAQNFSKKGLDQLRLLHDLGAASFPLFITGGEGCGSILRADPQLSDRVGGWVRFKELSGEELISALGTYHPFYAATDPDVLFYVDGRYAKGVLRRWARVLKTALPMAANNGTPDQLTRNVADAVLSIVVHEREDL